MVPGRRRKTGISFSFSLKLVQQVSDDPKAYGYDSEPSEKLVSCDCLRRARIENTVNVETFFQFEERFERNKVEMSELLMKMRLFVWAGIVASVIATGDVEVIVDEIFGIENGGVEQGYGALAAMDEQIMREMV